MGWIHSLLHNMGGGVGMRERGGGGAWQEGGPYSQRADLEVFTERWILCRVGGGGGVQREQEGVDAIPQ
jgi:hypothetical protein